MKTMKDLEKFSDKELTDFITEQRDITQKHRFGIGGRDVSAARIAKKNTARALTVLATRAQATNQ